MAYCCHCSHMLGGFYFLSSKASEIAICYGFSVCKYSHCMAGGLPIICVCGLCPVSAEGEFEKDAIVAE